MDLNLIGYIDRILSAATPETAYEQIYEQSENSAARRYRLHPYNILTDFMLNLYHEIRSTNVIERGQELAGGFLKAVGHFVNENALSKREDPFMLFAKQATRTGYSDRWGKAATKLVIRTNNSIELPSAMEMMEGGWTMFDGGVLKPLDFSQLRFISFANDWDMGVIPGKTSKKGAPMHAMFNAHGERLAYIADPQGKVYTVEVDFGGMGSVDGTSSIMGKIMRDVNHAGELPLVTVHVSPLETTTNTRGEIVPKPKTTFRDLPDFSAVPASKGKILLEAWSKGRLFPGATLEYASNLARFKYDPEWHMPGEQLGKFEIFPDGEIPTGAGAAAAEREIVARKSLADLTSKYILTGRLPRKIKHEVTERPVDKRSIRYVLELNIPKFDTSIRMKKKNGGKINYINLF